MRIEKISRYKQLLSRLIKIGVSKINKFLPHEKHKREWLSAFVSLELFYSLKVCLICKIQLAIQENLMANH